MKYSCLCRLVFFLLVLSQQNGEGQNATFAREEGKIERDLQHIYLPDPAEVARQRELDLNITSTWLKTTDDSPFTKFAVVVNPNPRPGRLANQLICYAQGQLYADTLGIYFAKPVYVPVRSKSRTPFGQNMLHPRGNNTVGNVSAGTILKVPTLGSPGLHGPTSDFFHQHYGNFHGLRERVRTILAPGPFLKDDEIPLDDEVVIHIRMWEGFGCGNGLDGCPGNRICKKTWPLAFGYTPDRDSEKCGRYAAHPPANFFRDVIRTRHAAGAKPWSKVWLVVEPRARKSPYLRGVIESLESDPLVPPVQMRPLNEAHVDFTFLTKANNLILTYGTYSWLAALLSYASEIHVPFTRGAYEGLWYPAPLLVVDDAPEYVYHDVEENGQGFQSVTTLTGENTAYSRAWRSRWRVQPRVIDRRSAWKSILQSFKDSSKKPPEWLIDYLK